MSMKRIELLKKQRADIDKLLSAEVKVTFPKGSEAYRKHGQNWIRCTVSDHGYDTDIFLKSVHSGKIVRRDATFEVQPA